MLLEILIPTFSREEYLTKNLYLLSKQISMIPPSNDIRVIVSDNASVDNTVLSVESIQKVFPVDLILLKSEKNLGGVANVLKLLSFAKADWVMFLGDDDFLPDGYIEFVIKVIQSENIGCVIPGFSSLYKDGSTEITREGKELKAQPGFSSVLKLSQFGHQLSGLVVRNNEMMLQTCLANQELRNSYLFIYFVSFNLLRENTIYAPQFQVLVSQGNAKDWAYDDSGLLTEVYQNYLSLFEDQPIKSILSCLVFTHKQSWRLRFSKDPSQSFRVVKHILYSQKLPIYLKTSVSIFYLFLYTNFLVKNSLRKILTKNKN
ncbi:MAG: glycosyltransferase family 2 protein [Snowella sp.]|nr:glycosyltransferase family 2 protein [Snowella sp.]